LFGDKWTIQLDGFRGFIDGDHLISFDIQQALQPNQYAPHPELWLAESLSQETLRDTIMMPVQFS
jgi:hypothetical protein